MGDQWISIGALAERSGVAASALRFYDDEGLLSSHRTESGRRQFPQHSLRRVAFIRVAQTVGLNLQEIKAAMATLPQQRTPTKADWESLSRSWQPLLQQRIDSLTALRDQLGACIGCGCLSLRSCALYNPADRAASLGSGPRFLMGNRSSDLPRD